MKEITAAQNDSLIEIDIEHKAQHMEFELNSLFCAFRLIGWYKYFSDCFPC